MDIDDAGINEAARLLGLEGVSVTQVKDDGAGGSTVYVVTAEDSARACPSCGVFATRLKDYRTTRPRHLPRGGPPLSIRWREARWHCTEPACPRGAFTEALRAVPAGMRTTTALRQAAGAAVCDGSRTVVQAGRDLRLSRPIVQRCFEGYAATVLPETPPATSAIGIDETPRGKPVWKQNPATQKWELLADAWHIRKGIPVPPSCSCWPSGP
ncbi:transposase family protein [Streptomyces sp. NPDC058067]|uniref:transposase family protein n=1 Tax=Streptomyces sp. NPDC058067 TaxID=3346324 RepID=UPI0036EF1F50